MSGLHQAVDDYLQLRRNLGYKLEIYGGCLRRFASFLNERKARHVTTKLALEFATQHRDHTPGVRVKRLLIVRGFARYLYGADPANEIPPPGLLPDKKPRARPHLYSAEEIRQLLEAAGKMHSPHRRHRLQPWTYQCLLGLLAVSGMRLGEVINLRCRDIDWSEGILTVHRSKFGKSRLVPLHPSTIKVLLAYAHRRDQIFDDDPDAPFLVTSRGTQLERSNVSTIFYKLSRQIGIRRAGGGRGPRLHDFRHRFAIETLLRWYRSGEHVERQLPALATYLGHVDVASTYWYLSCTPELMASAGQLLEKQWKGICHANTR
jgi:integrase